MYRLFIDDLRSPPDAGWEVARSSKAAINLMLDRGCPDQISFDHDLGGDDDAMVVVKWMIDQDLSQSMRFIPNNFHYQVHSANPVGSQNIRGALSRYLTFRMDEMSSGSAKP